MAVGAAAAFPLPAFSSFGLDYVVRGRIWVPRLTVEPDALASTALEVSLSDFADCPLQPAKREQVLEPQDRDCRFERQLRDALSTSGIFRHAVSAPLQGQEIDFVLSPRRSRVQFRRQVIPAVKPLVVLTLFTYLWTPLPFEEDRESYDLRLAILDRAGRLLSEVGVAEEFSHYLSPYSAERTAPDDLFAELEPTERALGPIVVCRGPHAARAVVDLLRQLGTAVSNLKKQESSRPILEIPSPAY